MKKIYQIPTIHVSRILIENMVAASLAVDASKTTDEQYVKGDNASRSDYNVWNDDWSK